MSFTIYITGFVIVVVGLIYGGVLVHVPVHGIVVGGIVLGGSRNTDGRQSHSPKGFGTLAEMLETHLPCVSTICNFNKERKQ